MPQPSRPPTFGSVSYTHLDVYKRQALGVLQHAEPADVGDVLGRAQQFPAQGFHLPGGGVHILHRHVDAPGPFSYTNLDVNKRQGLNGSGRIIGWPSQEVVDHLGTVLGTLTLVAISRADG